MHVHENLAATCRTNGPYSSRHVPVTVNSISSGSVVVVAFLSLSSSMPTYLSILSDLGPDFVYSGFIQLINPKFQSPNQLK